MEKQPKPLRTFTTRREFLRAGLVVPGSLVLAACVATPPTSPASQAEPATAPAAEEIAPEATPTPVPETGEAAQALAPTPACPDDDEATPAQTEGPFYTPDTPQRTSLREPGIPGTPMVLTGYVLGTNCQPVAGALLDFWHADDAGVYDNDGYRLRGHQFADEAGSYHLETVVPGLYPGRTRHFHVKVQAPNGPILTTQLYFPGEPANERDGIFRPELLMEVQENADGRTAVFSFVLDS